MLTERCFACAGSVPCSDGPTHRYLGAAPGCWHFFNDVLCREFSCFDPAVYRLTFDSYAVQHVGTESLQTVHSASLYLVGLCLSLDLQLPAEQVTRALARRRNCGVSLRWLDPPVPPGAITIVDVHAAGSLAEHVGIVRDWAASTLNAWQDHHSHIRVLVDALGFGDRPTLPPAGKMRTNRSGTKLRR